MPARLLPLRRDWSVLWPVQAKSREDLHRGYRYDSEEQYYKEYGSALFAYTYHKGGWDSMRHYEIMCNGGIPYFIGLADLPAHTMTKFPRSLVQSAMTMPGVSELGTVNLTEGGMDCLMDVRLALLEYCRANLSTVALAKYFLQAMNKPQAKKVLMINGRNQWEYLTDSLFHGLRVLLGPGFVDVRKRTYMYSNHQEAARLEGFRNYGKGFSYAWSLHDYKSVNRMLGDVAYSVSKRQFDVVVFGQLFRPIAEERRRQVPLG